MLPSDFLAHILPPSVDWCWLGFRFHSSPLTIQSLPFPPLGLHPSAPKRSPVRAGYSAAGRPGDSWPTGLSFSFGPSVPVSAWPIRFSAFRHSECLTSVGPGGGAIQKRNSRGLLGRF